MHKYIFIKGRIMNLLYIIFNCIAAFLFSSSIYATMIVRSHNLNLSIGWLLLFFIIGWMLCFIPIYISRNKQHKTFIAILTLLCVGLLSKTGLGTIGWLAMVLWAFFDKSSESMKKTNKQRIEKQNNKVKNCSQSIQKENTIKKVTEIHIKKKSDIKLNRILIFGTVGILGLVFIYKLYTSLYVLPELPHETPHQNHCHTTCVLPGDSKRHIIHCYEKCMEDKESYMKAEEEQKAVNDMMKKLNYKDIPQIVYNQCMHDKNTDNNKAVICKCTSDGYIKTLSGNPNKDMFTIYDLMKKEYHIQHNIPDERRAIIPWSANYYRCLDTDKR